MREGKKKNIILRAWEFLESIPDRLGRLCPPGFGYRSEINSNGALFGVGIGMSFPYLFQLKDAYDKLFMWVSYPGQAEPVYQIRYGATAQSFAEVIAGYWWWFLPWLLALVVNIIVHYVYYYRTTKSIYVMRRLSNPYVIVKSCLQAPLIQLAVGLAIALVIYIFDFGLYMWVMPEQCNPRFM